MSHVPYTRTSRPGRTAQLALGLAVLPTAVLLPAAAVAATSGPSTKAQIEHAERQSVSAPTKAQVEAAERAAAPRPAGAPDTTPAGDRPAVPSGGDAAAWQLAASGAFGAVLAGGVMVASRQIAGHRRPLAS